MIKLLYICILCIIFTNPIFGQEDPFANAGNPLDRKKIAERLIESEKHEDVIYGLIAFKMFRRVNIDLDKIWQLAHHENRTIAREAYLVIATKAEIDYLYGDKKLIKLFNELDKEFPSNKELNEKQLSLTISKILLYDSLCRTQPVIGIEKYKSWKTNYVIGCLNYIQKLNNRNTHMEDYYSLIELIDDINLKNTYMAYYKKSKGVRIK